MTKIVALGAGRMGRGIAQVFAYGGYEVSIIDFKERSADGSANLLREAKAEVEENLRLLNFLNVVQENEIEDTLNRIELIPLQHSKERLIEADYIFESVPETLKSKKDALSRASLFAGSGTVIASTTSTILSTKLATFTSKPSHFLNTHFLNPAFLIPLVEVSPCQETKQEIIDGLIALLEGIGKVPVQCKPSPGYIVPRLQSLIMSEACRMVEEGVASAEDIDRAVTSGLGIRFATMGPIEFVDWGGLDILYYANRYLSGELGNRYEIPNIVEEKMDKGSLGLKSGKGMYDYCNVDTNAYKEQKLETFITLLMRLDLMPKSAKSP